jgi:hypothetical protein
VPVAQVQTQLRRQFGRWGLPNALRVDNGTPWNRCNDLPTALVLWLVGLGLEVRWNDPRCPQQNGKVERSQGTGKRWAEPGSCRDVAELQAHLDEADQIQRECYPAVAGRSRRAAFPQLRHSGRPYRRRLEEQTWSLERVLQHLAEYLVPRVVSSGRVSLYDHRYYVGRTYDRQTLYVQLNPDDALWIITDAEGRELRRHPARELTRERITKLDLADQS